MIAGRFGENGELLFEIELVASNGKRFSIIALLDTGFTGWLAINLQDLEALGWRTLASQIEMQVAQGREFFRLCQGLVVIGGKEYLVPVHVGDKLTENLLGSQWLETMQLVVNKPQGILTLGMVGSE